MEQGGPTGVAVAPGGAAGKAATVGKKRAAARGEKNRTFAGSVYREAGLPASKDYTIALV
jgi:hypothetical protein